MKSVLEFNNQGDLIVYRDSIGGSMTREGYVPSKVVRRVKLKLREGLIYVECMKDPLMQLTKEQVAFIHTSTFINDPVTM